MHPLSSFIGTEMNSSIDWESIHYENLPHWMKKVSKPRGWISTTRERIFYGKNYIYKVIYSIDGGQLHKSYWRTPRRQRRKRKKVPIGIIIVLILLIAGVWFILANQSALIQDLMPSDNQVSQSISPDASSITSPTSVPTTIRTIKTTPPITVKESDTLKTAPKSNSFIYTFNNARGTIQFTSYGGLAEYFGKESHTYYQDPEKEVIMELLMNEKQDDSISPLIQQIKMVSSSPDNQAKIAISLVQHIPYNWGKFYGTSMDWYYPYETLYHNKGVCADKSILLVYLLNKLGYDAVLFDFPGHMAVGIKSDSRYSFQSSGYAFIETTRPTIVTYIPEDYFGGFTITSNFQMIHLNGGTRSLDVSQEYQDGGELKRIEAMGTVLDQYNYNRWLAISNQYDLQYDT